MSVFDYFAGSVAVLLFLAASQRYTDGTSETWPEELRPERVKHIGALGNREQEVQAGSAAL